MNIRFILLLLVVGLAGCATPFPAPVSETPAARIEAPGPGAAAGAVAEKLHTVAKGETLYSIARKFNVAPRDLATWNNLADPTQLKVGQPLRVGPPQPVAAVTVAPVLPAGSAEVRPIETGGPVAARPLDGGAPSAAVAPAPVFSGDAGKIKTAPKGGKLPYSEENLALLKRQETGGSPAAAVAPVAAVPEKPAPAPSAPGANEVNWAWPAPGKVIATFSEGGNGAEASKGIDIAGRTGDPVLAAGDGKIVYVGNGLRGYGNLVIVKHTTDFLSAYAHNSRILVKEGQAVKRGQKIAEIGNSDTDQPKLHFEVRHLGKPTDPLKYLPAR